MVFILKGENLGKIGDTKRKIVRLLSEKNMTLSELSIALSLATSTISGHLDELKEAEVIAMIENSHIKRWKYYTVTPSQIAESRYRPNGGKWQFYENISPAAITAKQSSNGH